MNCFELISEEVRRHSPSYGLAPYYLKEVLLKGGVVESGESQKPFPLYIAIYLWEDYSTEDLMHHLKHSKEFLDLPEASKVDFIRFQAKRLSSEVEFQRWKCAHAAIAAGIVLGCCKKMGSRAIVVKECGERDGIVCDTNFFCLIEIQ